MPFIIAYHGCDLGTAQQLLGGSPFQPSTQDYDWLGAGSYFWENDPVRAYQWASEPRRKFSYPSVVGAVIELGKCLDLTTQTGIEAVRVAYQGFVTMAERDHLVIPENIDPGEGISGDKIIRRLDCAVMNYLYEILQSEPTIQPYATVRALFPEGHRLYPSAGFLNKTHIQICVREPEQIFGVFRVPDWQRKELGLPILYECV